MDKGYIYIRNHESYDVFNACKLGKTLNLGQRDSQYSTSEIKRGYFYPVIEIDNTLLNKVEFDLKDYFYDRNIKFNAGKEFYDSSIKNDIECYFKEKNIKYKLLTKDEITNLILDGLPEKISILSLELS
jgi:hypothetical protein